ncbi:MAG: hypothetical protein HY882_05185 [Deltaproteobacteria bacterium]|nr:hypothetical protein [Deltaproteobacteria bacterium]
MNLRGVTSLAALSILAFSLVLRRDSPACTLYAAIGSAVEGGGVLVGKTRDLMKQEEQFLLKETSSSGYSYLGIASRKNSRLTAGINEQGLIIVNASAASIKDRLRKHLRIESVLGRAASGEEALKIFREEGMRSPIHYLLADQKNLVLLEVYNPERLEMRNISEGVLVHTNHYLLPSMADLNGKIDRSSSIRLDRIQSLMKDPPFKILQFISFARDHLNGPGHLAICRHRLPGSKSGGITVSAIVFRLQEGKPPEIWFRLGQPCEGPFQKISF